MADRAVVNVGQSWQGTRFVPTFQTMRPAVRLAGIEGASGAEPLTLESAGNHLWWAVGER